MHISLKPTFTSLDFSSPKVCVMCKMIKLKIGMKFLSIAVFEGVRIQNNIYIKNLEPYTYIILILNPLAINPLMNSLHEKLASCRFRRHL